MQLILSKGRTLSGGAGRWRFFLFLAFMVMTLNAYAQPDYAAAQYIPPACSKWYTTGNGHSFVVIHDMEGYYQTTISYLNRCDLDTNGDYNVATSVYYAVNSLKNGSDAHNHRENNTGDAAIGEITQFVRESNYAWHALCWNRYMFGTEHEGFVNDPAWYTLGMYQSSAGLQRHLCEKNGIAKDRNHVIAHGEKATASWVSWMSTNWPSIDATCNDHTDPGQYWNWTYFMSLLNADTNVTGTYWDLNGATAGYGTTPNGTWGLSVSNWNGIANGTGKAGLWINPANAIFNADAANAYTVTLVGTQTVYSVQVLSGNPTFNGGGLNFTGTGTYYSNYVAAGLTATFNTPMTGNGLGAPDKWGPGTAVYNSAALVGSSYMTINEGTIAIGNDSAFGTNKFYIGEPTGVNVVSLKSANTTAHTVSNRLVLYAASFIVGSNADLTFGGGVDMRTAVRTVTVSNANTTFSGTMTNTGGLTKAGPGTLILAGTAANTFTGVTTVNAGILKLNKTAGVNALASTSLVINSGATVLIGAANQIADTVAVTLAGGTINTTGLSENAGTLKLTANSLLDLAAGNSVLKFAASSAVAWTASTTLTVTNWNGSVNGGGSDQLFVGTSSGGVTTTQLGQIKFINPPGFDPGTYAAKILTSGEIVPLAVPLTFAVQPVGQKGLVGTNVIFTVSLNGTAPMGYQWRWNGSAISGATTNQLILTNATLGSAGSYLVIVTNVAGTVTSGTATLNMYATAAASFSGVGPQAAGQFSFNITGVPGWRYIIGQSSNLIDWDSVLTNFAPFTFTDTNVVNNPALYFRATYAP